MKRIFQWGLASAGLLALAAGVYATTATGFSPFKDPLDVPAMASALAPKHALRAVTFSGERLYAVGIRGHILHTADPTGNWEQSRVPTSVDLNAVTFIDKDRGWAVGHDAVVLYTDNGGISWYRRMDSVRFNSEITAHYQRRIDRGETGLEPFLKMADAMSQPTTDKIFLDVFFDSDRKGFVVGPFGLLLRSDNAGATWEPWFDRIDNPRQAHLHAIRKVGDDLYIAGEMGQVWRLDPDTKRFELAAPTGTKGSLFGIVGDESFILTFGLRGRAFVSTDKGRSWTESQTGVTAGIASAALLPDGRIAAVTQAGHVLISNDKGATFAVGAPTKPSKLAGLLPLSDGRVTIVGLNGLSTETLK